jgi:hypothetical protein
LLKTDLYVISLKVEFVTSHTTLGNLLDVDIRLVVNGPQLAAQKGQIRGCGGHLKKWEKL